MTTYSITQVEQAMAAILAYVSAEAEKSATSVLGKTSGFWKQELSARPNYPSVSDYLAFRREGFTHGMADGFSFDLADARKQNLAKEEAHARRTCEIFRQSAAINRIVALDEASLGAPFIFENYGVYRSASFWTNAATALRVKDLLDAHGQTNYSQNILEIGAGWGCMAHQLHQLLGVNSYTIVDLPENLFLSTTYISSTMARKPLFATGTPHSVMAEPKSLICSVPGAVAAIGQKYDVVVNSFSLQEMDLETVQGYFAWIAQILSDEGLFLSFNSHGKAGVRIPSDYPLDRFQLHHLGMFRAYPSNFMNTIPYEMVLSRRKAGAPIDAAIFNVLCCLLQFGLGEDLNAVCGQFVQGTLPDPVDRTLRALAGYFSMSAGKRTVALAAATALSPALHAYLEGMDAFVRGESTLAKAAFERSLDGGLKGFARLRASAHLAILTKQKALPKWKEDFDARMAYAELAQMLDVSNPNHFIVQFERIVSVELPVSSPKV